MTPKDIDVPVVNIFSVDIIEDKFRIEGRRATHGGEMGRGFEQPITIHIAQWRIVDFPVSAYSIMEILGIVGAMVHQH